MNNAGIDGCSSFRHQAFLNKHIFDYNPYMTLFLVGVNEMHVATSVGGDTFIHNSREGHLQGFAQKSELFSFLWDLYRQKAPKKRKIGHSSTKILLKRPESIQTKIK